jgi:hypothetical protein
MTGDVGHALAKSDELPSRNRASSSAGCHAGVRRLMRYRTAREVDYARGRLPTRFLPPPAAADLEV